MDLQDKKALITGGTSGMGIAAALAMAEKGASRKTDLRKRLAVNANKLRTANRKVAGDRDQRHASDAALPTARPRDVATA